MSNNKEQLYNVKLKEKKQIADKVILLTFDAPENFSFIPGQFIQISVPCDGGSIWRAYSLACVPNEKNIRLCLKVVVGGKGSTYLKNMNVQDELVFKGPYGHFGFKNEDKKGFFVATGCGMAPIMSIIRDQLENKKNKRELSLIFGLRHEKDIFWTKELDDLQNKYPNFHYNITLSQPIEAWDGLIGRVTDHLPKIETDTQYLICGNKQMASDVRSHLIEHGVDSNFISFEAY